MGAVARYVVAWASGWLHLRHRFGLAPLGPVVVGIVAATALGGDTGKLTFQTVREIVVPISGLLIVRSVTTAGEGSLRSRPTRAIAMVVVD